MSTQRDQHSRNTLLLVPPVCWDFGLGVPMRVVCTMPSVCCGGCLYDAISLLVVDFSPSVKPPAQRERDGRCWYNPPYGFHCGTLVASVTSGCLLHSCGASKGSAGPDLEIYCFPPWWQHPPQVHRDLSVLWVLSIYCLQWMQLLPSITCLPIGTVTLSIAN